MGLSLSMNGRASGEPPGWPLARSLAICSGVSMPREPPIGKPVCMRATNMQAHGHGGLRTSAWRSSLGAKVNGLDAFDDGARLRGANSLIDRVSRWSNSKVTSSSSSSSSGPS